MENRRVSSKDAMRGVYRDALAAAGARRLELENAQRDETSRLAELAIGARAAGISLSEIARVTGLSRPTVYALIEQSGPPEPDLDYQILSAAAGHGRVSIGHLTGATNRPADEIAERCGQLVSAGYVNVATASSGSDEVAYYGLTYAGEERLEAMLYELGAVAETQFFAYLPIPGEAVDAVYAATVRRFHPNDFALIAAGTAHDVQQPELALQLRAATEPLAHERADALFRDILRAARVPGVPRRIRILRR